MAGQELILTTVLSLVFSNTSYDNTHLFDFNNALDRNALIESLKGKHLVIATTQNYPLSYAVERNGSMVGDGVAFNFVKLLQSKYGFNYTTIVPEDDILGDQRRGIFGLLTQGKADMAAAFLPVVREGQSIIQYSRNLDTGEWVVLMRRPTASAQGSGLLAPFTLGVWLLILVSLTAVGPIIYALILLRNWLCPYDENNLLFPLPSCVWFVYGALLKQGSTLSPVSDSARLIFATWWIFITILTAFYTANLTAFLTLSQFTLPIQKPSDIKVYDWVTRKGNAIENAAMDTSEVNIRTNKAKFVTMNNTDILRYFVDQKNYLFLQEKPIVDHLMYNDYLTKSKDGIEESLRCTFVITNWAVIARARAFAYKKNFEWSELFDYTLQHLVEAGIIKYRLGEGLPNTKICPLNLNNKERQLQNSDLWTTYKVIFVGFGIAAFVFICEVFMRYRKKFCAKKLDTTMSRDNNYNNKFYGKGNDLKGNYFTPPPPSYQTLFGQKNRQKKIVNGTDYWVFKSPEGESRLVPVRTPSALLFQYTN